MIIRELSLFLFSADFHEDFFKGAVGNSPGFDRILELVLVQAMGLLALQFPDKLDQVMVFSDSDDQTTASAVHNPHIWKHLLDPADHLLPVLTILQVYGQPVSLAV